MAYLFEPHLDYWKRIWYEADTDLSMDHVGSQRKNDRALRQLKRHFLRWLETNPSVNDLSSAPVQQELKSHVIPFMEGTLGVDSWACKLLDEEGYYETTSHFITRVKSDFPETSFEDIFQALRNIWVMISLQVYMDEPVGLTDAIYAYSMLYPLTDNYLDDATIPAEDKKAFNQRFYHKIKDNIHEPCNPSEEDIFHMIDLIHRQYDRNQYPQVTQSLLAILDGQNRSLDQQDIQSIYDLDLLSYTFYKGGTSVLADAWLIKGSLSEAQGQFAYGYGVLLQLADDLQDLDEDLKAGHATLMNTQKVYGQLDGLLKRYHSVIDHFFDRTFEVRNNKQLALKQLLKVSMELLLFGGISANKNYVSKPFYRAYTKQSRFSKKSYDFMNKRLIKSIQLRA